MNKLIDDTEILENDKNIQEAKAHFSEVETKSDEIANDMASKLMQRIIEEDNSEKFNLSTAIMATAKTLSILASFMYQEEPEFLKDVRMARESVVASVIPALLDPKPCGLCEKCKNGHPEDCINPTVRPERTTSRFLPIMCNMLLEYDLYNKMLWMYTAGRQEDIDSEPQNKDDLDMASGQKKESEEKI